MKINVSLAFVPPHNNERPDSFRLKLEKAGVFVGVISAVLAIVAVGPSLKDSSARAYARSMEQAFDEYGLEGLKTQIAYFLINARGWRDGEAVAYKKVLSKFTRHL